MGMPREDSRVALMVLAIIAVVLLLLVTGVSAINFIENGRSYTKVEKIKMSGEDHHPCPR
jgi:cell division septal protein FtsQ